MLLMPRTTLTERDRPSLPRRFSSCLPMQLSLSPALSSNPGRPAPLAVWPSASPSSRPMRLRLPRRATRLLSTATGASTTTPSRRSSTPRMPFCALVSLFGITMTALAHLCPSCLSTASPLCRANACRTSLIPASFLSNSSALISPVVLVVLVPLGSLVLNAMRIFGTTKFMRQDTTTVGPQQCDMSQGPVCTCIRRYRKPI